MLPVETAETLFSQMQNRMHVQTPSSREPERPSFSCRADGTTETGCHGCWVSVHSNCHNADEITCKCMRLPNQQRDWPISQRSPRKVPKLALCPHCHRRSQPKPKNNGSSCLPKVVAATQNIPAKGPKFYILSTFFLTKWTCHRPHNHSEVEIRWHPNILDSNLQLP